MNYHPLIGLFGRGGLYSQGRSFYSILAFVACLEFMLDDRLILGSCSLRVILLVLTKFRTFSLSFSSKFIDLFEAILSTEDYPNRCFGNISLMLRKSRLLGMFILPISLLLETPLEF